MSSIITIISETTTLIYGVHKGLCCKPAILYLHADDSFYYAITQHTISHNMCRLNTPLHL